MRKLFCSLWILSAALAATISLHGEQQAHQPQHSPSLDHYLGLFKKYPATFGPLGNWKKGEIEIVLDPQLIQRTEKQMRSRLISKGFSEEDAIKWSSIGIVAEDLYWMWVRDAVMFPSGVVGTYDRLLWRSGIEGGPPGVAILPVLANKKIIVNINYRHATRSWELELPRGQKRRGETLEKAADRELHEETGYHATKCAVIGEMSPDSGALMSVIPLIYAEVSLAGESKQEYSEAIVNNPAFYKEELKEAFKRGYTELLIKGELVKVPCRDPFLAFAILQAELKGLL